MLNQQPEIGLSYPDLFIEFVRYFHEFYNYDPTIFSMKMNIVIYIDSVL